MAQFAIDPSYKEVSERMADFFEKHPEGSFQTVGDPWLMEVDGKSFLCYKVACYRTPDDERPGIAMAWEPVPGTTPYTKNSELMNAETSAWGRAIIAIGASTAKKIASANEVRNRRAEQEVPSEEQPVANVPGNGASTKQMNKLRIELRHAGITDDHEVHAWCSRVLAMQVDSLTHLTSAQISKCIDKAAA